jgi:hypothetical protein
MIYQHDWKFIRQGLRDQGKTPNEIMIMVRRWKRAVAIAERLDEAGLHDDDEAAAAIAEEVA